MGRCNSTTALLAVIFSITLLNIRAKATQLNGTYTIDAVQTASTTNFKNLSSAVTYLTGAGVRSDAGPANSAPFGVSGPVVFSVAAGTYNERLIINAITGTSGVNTITFQAATGNASSVILTNNFTSAGFLINMTRADYFVFKNLTLTPSSTNNAGIGALSTTFSVGDSIVNCVLNNNTSSNSLTASITNSKNVVLKGNVFNASTNHFTGSLDTTIVIAGNTFFSAFSNTSSLSLTDVNGYRITDNVLTGATPQGYNNGIILTSNSSTAPVNPCQLTNNKLSNTNGISIQVYNGYYSSTNKLLIANNFIQLLQGTGLDMYGYYPGGNVNIFHNTINHTGINGTCYGTFFFSNVTLKNNIFNNKAFPTSVTLIRDNSGNSSYAPLLDYNVYFSGDTTKYAVPRSRDAHAIFESIPFLSATDLHHTQACIKA